MHLFTASILLISSILSTGALATDPEPPGTQPIVASAAEASSTAKSGKPTPPSNPLPTLANVPYGTHEREVLDFWQAPSASHQPTPVVFYMHGGAWMSGDKANVRNVEKYLAAGISVVSINYRFVWQARDAKIMPPVEWPMHDAARALQFVRSKAAEWKIDKQRIAASGGSAGACTSLWLAFHKDLADPQSDDPVSRESTRLWCAAVDVPQTSLDPRQMVEWTPNSIYGGHAFGFKSSKDYEARKASFAEFLAHREDVLPWIKEYSPFELASPGAPPIYLQYPSRPGMGQPQKDPTHTANFGVKLKEKLDQIGVACELAYPGAPDVKHASMEDFLIEKLKS